MEKMYRVIFQGLASGKDRFRADMRRLGVPGDVVEALLRRAPISVKKGVTLQEARRYADALEAAGAKVTVRAHGVLRPGSASHSIAVAPLREFIMCPKCGLKQSRGGVCRKCGAKLLKTTQPTQSQNDRNH